MKTKLTLTLNKELLDRAKIYAKEHGTSLSKMVESYFQNIGYISDVICDFAESDTTKEIMIKYKHTKGNEIEGA